MQLLVSVEQRVDAVQVRLDLAVPGEVQPVDGAPFKSDSEVVHGEGTIGETKIEHSRHDSTRARGAPGEVRGMPVSVAPLGFERSEQAVPPF